MTKDTKEPPAFDRRKLCVHHVGGRFGTGAFPRYRVFEPDLVNVYYDADVDCIEQIKEKHRSRRSEVLVLPYCIGDSDRTGMFTVNYDPTTSSLYRFNPEYSTYYFYCYTHDFVISENMKPMEEREVRVIPLDKLIRNNAADAPPPDFLSIDAQGSEYGILQGAEQTLRGHVLALVVETVFHPLYEEERTFGDIHRFLADRGFHFARFLSWIDYTPYRRPVGLRGEGFQVSTDALFLRRIEDLENTVRNDSLLCLMLRKLAFIAIVYGQFEYGLECLERSRRLRVPREEGLADLAYDAFLREVEEKASSMRRSYPPTFTEKYTFAFSKQRFAGAGRQAAQAGGGKKGWREAAERLWLATVYSQVHTLVRLYNSVVRGFWAPLASRILPNSPVERVLIRYGLRKQALLLKKNRIYQFPGRLASRKSQRP